VVVVRFATVLAISDTSRHLAGERRHAYTVSTSLPEITQLVESMLYKSIRGLEETKLLLLSLGRHYHRTKQLPVAKLFFRKQSIATKPAWLTPLFLAQEALSGGL
jgi:two-component system chemotaxis response regulator CheB